MAAPGPSNTPTPPSVGMVLAERYRLEAALGAGGMAEVYRALDLISGRRVAVKVLRPQLSESAEALVRFRREGQVLGALKNPAVVAIESVQELEGGRIFIVMELLEGETLGSRMKRGAMTARDLAPIVAGCAAGLAAAHAQGVVHRDLKPDNIFLSRLSSQGDIQLKLLDFGVSKVRGEEKLTQTGQVLGTPRYMSPEQLGAEPDIDPRVDVYALGVILYEALSGGKSPFVATTPTDLIVAILNGKVVPLRSVKPDVPAALEAVVLRAMAKVRAARYGSAPELAEAFFEAGDVQAKATPRLHAGTNVMGSMRTSAFGGSFIEGSTPAPAPALAELAATGHSLGTDPSLKQGTFSELAAFDIRPVERGTLEPGSSSDEAPPVARVSMPGNAPRAIPPTALSPAVSLPEPVRTVGPTEPAPLPLATTRPTGPRGEPSRPVRHDPSGQRYVPEPPIEPVPMSGLPSGVVLIVVGLLAGGLAAGAVIATLTWLQQASGSMPAIPPPPPPSAVVAGPADGGEADAGAPSTAAATGVLAPTSTRRDTTSGSGAEAATTEAATTEAATTEATTEAATTEAATATTTEAAHGAEPRTGGSDTGRRTGATASTSPSETSTPETSPPEPVDPIIAATRALGRGDAAECVDILDDVIARGGNPLALRRRADCLARMGDMSEAIRDYQRFCRLVPDHPGIGEVREILEGLGQTCP